MPCDLVVAVEVETQQEGVESHFGMGVGFEVRRDLIDERLKPGGYGVVGLVFGPSSVECRVAGRFAGFLEAIGFVFDSVPGHVFEECLVPIGVVLIVVGGKQAAVHVNMEAFGGIVDDEDFGGMARAC